MKKWSVIKTKPLLSNCVCQCKFRRIRMQKLDLCSFLFLSTFVLLRKIIKFVLSVYSRWVSKLAKLSIKRWLHQNCSVLIFRQPATVFLTVRHYSWVFFCGTMCFLAYSQKVGKGQNCKRTTFKLAFIEDKYSIQCKLINCPAIS